MAARYLRARVGVTLLTVLSLSLGVALPCAILLIREQAEQALLREGAGVDMVVGGKGSPLQLVLSAVHHLDAPTGNIPHALYEELKADRRVEAAVPLALGDNLMGYRIVGTSPAMFDWRPRGHEADSWLSLREGRRFSDPFDAVLGAEVARSLNLRPGDTFVGSHGLRHAPGTEHDDFPYTVTGVLQPTGSAVDRLILTTVKAVWLVHEADEELHRGLFGVGARTEREPEVTAVWLRLRGAGIRMWMRDEINRGTDAMAAVPVDELHRLNQRVLRPVEQAMLWIAGAVALVSGLAILATLLQSADRRRRDWAVLRTLGAHPRDILALVWIESLLITTLGTLLGLVLAHGGLAAARNLGPPGLLADFSPWRFAELQGTILLIIWLGGVGFGIIPALNAYRRHPVEDLTRED